MPVIAIPKALRKRLGEEGSEGLVELISAVDERAREDSLRLLEERFERRLSEEIGKVNERITSLEERLERRLSQEIGRVNERVTEEAGKLRAEMHDEIGRLRVEMGGLRAELIKWMFIFWIGQIAVLGGLIVGLFNLR